MNKKMIFRVAGICQHNGKVLLHRAEIDDFWALPGGKCEFGEDSTEALAREFKEELDTEIEIGKLLWVVENFFNYEGSSFHEVGLYYQCHFKNSSDTFYEQKEFTGKEDFYKQDQSLKLHFKWFTENDLRSTDIRPKFLKQELFSIPENTRRIVNRDNSKT